MACPTQCALSSMMPSTSGLTSGSAFLGSSLPGATPHNSSTLSTNPGAIPHNSLNMGDSHSSQPGFPGLGHPFSSTQSAPSRFNGSCSSTQQNPGKQHGAGPFGLESFAKMVNKFPGRNTSNLRELSGFGTQCCVW